MITIVYKWGNPCRAIFVTQVVDTIDYMEDVERQVRPRLEALGFDTKNGYAEISVINAPIYFV